MILCRVHVNSHDLNCQYYVQSQLQMGTERCHRYWNDCKRGAGWLCVDFTTVIVSFCFVGSRGKLRLNWAHAVCLMTKFSKSLEKGHIAKFEHRVQREAQIPVILISVCRRNTTQSIVRAEQSCEHGYKTLKHFIWPMGSKSLPSKGLHVAYTTSLQMGEKVKQRCKYFFKYQVKTGQNKLVVGWIVWLNSEVELFFNALKERLLW